MRSTLPIALLLCSLFSIGCSHNPWWEASRSGWAQYGMVADVPKKAKPVPVQLLPDAATWDRPIYIEGWIDTVDRDNGEWIKLSDGTSAPVTILPEGGFTFPRNARGRRAMAWGRPLVASSSVRSEGEPVRSNVQVEFVAKSVMIQGFYGLEAPPAPKFRAPPAPPPQPTIPAAEAQPVNEFEPEPQTELKTEPETAKPEQAPPPPPPVVDLPDR